MSYREFFSTYLAPGYQADGSFSTGLVPLSNFGYQYIAYVQNAIYIIVAFLFTNNDQHRLRLVFVGNPGGKTLKQVFMDIIHDDCLQWARELEHIPKTTTPH